MKYLLHKLYLSTLLPFLHVRIMYAPAHTLSKKSARQQRNVFIWCSRLNKIAMGWRVDTDSPTSITTAYRWITTLDDPDFTPEPIALFPVVVRPSNVLTYAIKRNGSALSRGSEENIAPGDYGIYNKGKKVTSFKKISVASSPNNFRWLGDQ